MAFLGAFRGVCGTDELGKRTPRKLPPPSPSYEDTQTTPQRYADASGPSPAPGPPLAGMSGQRMPYFPPSPSPAALEALPPPGHAFWRQPADELASAVHDSVSAALANAAAAAAAAAAPPRGAENGGYEGQALPAALEAKAALATAVEWLQANNRRLKASTAQAEERCAAAEAAAEAARNETEEIIARAEAQMASLRARIPDANSRPPSRVGGGESAEAIANERRAALAERAAAQKAQARLQTEVETLRRKLHEAGVRTTELEEALAGTRHRPASRMSNAGGGGAAGALTDAPFSTALAESRGREAELEARLATAQSQVATMEALSKSREEELKNANSAVAAKRKLASELEKLQVTHAALQAAAAQERDRAVARERQMKDTIAALQASDNELNSAQLAQRITELQARAQERAAMEARRLGGAAAALTSGAGAASNDAVPLDPRAPEAPPSSGSSLAGLAELENARMVARRAQGDAEAARAARAAASAEAEAAVARALMLEQALRDAGIPVPFGARALLRKAAVPAVEEALPGSPRAAAMTPMQQPVLPGSPRTAASDLSVKSLAKPASPRRVIAVPTAPVPPPAAVPDGLPSAPRPSWATSSGASLGGKPASATVAPPLVRRGPSPLLDNPKNKAPPPAFTRAPDEAPEPGDSPRAEEGVTLASLAASLATSVDKAVPPAAPKPQSPREPPPQPPPRAPPPTAAQAAAPRAVIAPKPPVARAVFAPIVRAPPAGPPPRATPPVAAPPAYAPPPVAPPPVAAPPPAPKPVTAPVAPASKPAAPAPPASSFGFDDDDEDDGLVGEIAALTASVGSLQAALHTEGQKQRVAMLERSL